MRENSASLPSQPLIPRPAQPEATHIAGVKIEPSPHCYTRQILGWSGSDRKLIGHSAQDQDAARATRATIARILEVRLAQYRDRGAGGPDVGVIAPLRCCELIAQEHPQLAPASSQHLVWGHYGAIRGLDLWSHVPYLMVLGRPLPPPDELETMASVIHGRRVATLPPGEWYPSILAGLRMRDRSLREVPTVAMPVHPDPLVEDLRRAVCDDEVLQAIGRARGIRRTAADPVLIEVLCGICVDWTYDEAVPWTRYLAEVGPVDLAVARLGLDRAAREVQTLEQLGVAVPDLGMDANALRVHLQRNALCAAKWKRLRRGASIWKARKKLLSF